MELLSDIKPSTWLNIIGFIFILIGTIFIFLAIKSTRENIASQSWPRIGATLKNIEIEKRIREGDADDYYRRYVNYYCVLTYQYEISGNILSATKSERVDTLEKALSSSQEYNIGETTYIYYDPQYPDNHRFNIEPPYRGLLWLLPFCAFAGFGLATIHVGRHFFT